MNKDQRLFGTSGIRKKVNDLPPEFIEDLARSLGSYSRDKEIAVGMDTRPSSERLKKEFSDGLHLTGHDTVDLGIVPTPTLAMATERYGTGIVITASHNPPEYNGFKFWKDGRAYSLQEEKAVEKLFYTKKFRENSGGGSVRREDYIVKHINRILENVGEVDREVRVLVDCANGAGSVITPQLLKEMGCHVIAINTEPSGDFPHPLEPTEENLRDVCRQVKEENVDVGIAHDGDADRSAAIDGDGKLIDWDSFLAVLAYGKGRVVTTVDASMRIEDVCGEVIRTPVGDVSVANGIRESGAEFGGEPSGSFIFPEVHMFPDGVLTAAKVVKLVSENRFYENLARIIEYPTARVKIPCLEEEKEVVMERLHGLVDGCVGEITYVDGIRIAVDGGWMLLRPSGTESFIRITAEGRNEGSLRELVGRGRDWISEAMGD